MSWDERDWSRPPGSSGRFAENPLTWAPTIGRVAGIRIQVHLVFILYVIFELLEAGANIAWAAQGLVVLFGSVLLHEFGHCFAARKVGGQADQILIWPLGGLAMVNAPRAPWPQFVTIVWGPLVNVILCVITATALRFDVSLNPFTFPNVYGDPWTSLPIWLALIYRTNLVLFYFNLWPMYPMDGGRILQSALWQQLGYRRGSEITTTVGMIGAIVMGLYGLVTRQFMIVGIAVMGYLLCLQEKQTLKAGFAEGDEWMYGGAPEKKREGWIARWRRRQSELRRARKMREREAIQEEADRILDKVHRSGIQSLTSAEKRILEEATRQQAESHRGPR